MQKVRGIVILIVTAKTCKYNPGGLAVLACPNVVVDSAETILSGLSHEKVYSLLNEFKGKAWCIQTINEYTEIYELVARAKYPSD